MSSISIGLVGCGRIGRCLVRLLTRREGLRLAAIEDPASPDAVEYLLRFDTLLGRFPEALSRQERKLRIADQEVELLAPDPGGSPPPWRDLGVAVVVEATGERRTRAQLDAHLEAGAKRVVLCSPPAEPPDLTLVAGVNDDQLERHHRIVSAGSVTANCAGPLLRVLIREFGVERVFLTSVHAYTTQLGLADVPSPGMRSGRAAAENIIPLPTNADEVLGELLPALAGRISGLALHVPVPNGSLVDLTCWHPRPLTAEAINAAVRAACEAELRGILAFETEPIVSSDILHTSYSGVFDALSTMLVAGRVSKTLTFYDNAWGYANRVLDLLGRLIELEEEETAA
jgi:glyceraldehyde 3-phosphate dehydrogenase